jgi:hypothetical protein
MTRFGRAEPLPALCADTMSSTEQLVQSRLCGYAIATEATRVKGC